MLELIPIQFLKFPLHHLQVQWKHVIGLELFFQKWTLHYINFDPIIPGIKGRKVCVRQSTFVYELKDIIRRESAGIWSQELCRVSIVIVISCQAWEYKRWAVRDPSVIQRKLNCRGMWTVGRGKHCIPLVRRSVGAPPLFGSGWGLV